MTIWLDAHLSPAIASWISRQFSVSAVAIRDLGLRNAVEQSGPPPQVILLACGNTSNCQLRQILQRTFVQTMEWIRKGEPVVEIIAS
jgi:predicted nuclease of predicted toxin-antitoxin system